MAKKAFYFCLVTFCLATFCFFGYRVYIAVFFPIKYDAEIRLFSDKHGVDRTLVFSVINTESHFRDNAVSGAGAVGLMQLMPSTALWLAGQLGMEDYSDPDLCEPAVNIELGTYYLKYLFEKFGDKRLALAAYNAGEGTVRNWLRSDAQLSMIPYKETEQYILKVARAEKVYRRELAAKLR